MLAPRVSQNESKQRRAFEARLEAKIAEEQVAAAALAAGSTKKQLFDAQ
jgi:6-phosphogluconolactonase/glucosamine-6-phosphate isomerase/deaminase